MGGPWLSGVAVDLGVALLAAASAWNWTMVRRGAARDREGRRLIR